ncbi:MAG: carboxyl transferase domain-containing protein [Dehalococcoidales bacterium]|nr:carboxyl transferase domain-containing protein [Dehalococcoidales bacterium]
MVWQSEIDEMKYRESLAEQLGGKEGVQKQHENGKLTVRERVAKLADTGSFREVGKLAGVGTYEGEKLVAFRPANSVAGICTINGRKVALSGGDFTVRGGAADAAVGDKPTFVMKLALDWHMPYIRLLDATGGSVRTFEQMGRTYVPDSNDRCAIAGQLLGIAPVVSAVLGSVAGLPAVEACLAHFNLMVKGTSQVFAGGPPVVKAALGYDIKKQELGDERTQVYEGGVIDNLVDNEEQAFETIKRFLSYLPNNVWEMPPRVETKDDPNRREEKLLSIIPRERKRTYNPYQILKYVLDRDSLFEIAPFYGRSRITGFARVNGYPVGVMINNPMFLGGSLDVAAGSKVIRFLQLCDTFHLPLVYFADEPGFMVGIEAQKQGIVRAGAKVVLATCATKMPWISFIIRQCYGVAGQNHNRPGGMFKRVAWPSVNWGSMHIEGGASAAYRREIEAAPDHEAKRAEIERMLQAIASPFRTAEAFDIEEIIDPRESRPILCEFIETAQSMIKNQLGPSAGPSYWP